MATVLLLGDVGLFFKLPFLFHVIARGLVLISEEIKVQ